MIPPETFRGSSLKKQGEVMSPIILLGASLLSLWTLEMVLVWARYRSFLRHERELFIEPL